MTFCRLTAWGAAEVPPGARLGVGSVLRKLDPFRISPRVLGIVARGSHGSGPGLQAMNAVKEGQTPTKGIWEKGAFLYEVCWITWQMDLSVLVSLCTDLVSRVSCLNDSVEQRMPTIVMVD